MDITNSAKVVIHLYELNMNFFAARATISFYAMLNMTNASEITLVTFIAN